MLPIRTFARRRRNAADIYKQDAIAPYQMVMYRIIGMERKLDQILTAKTPSQTYPGIVARH